YFFEQNILELDAKDYEIHEVWQMEGEEHKPLDIQYNQQVLSVQLPRVYTANDTLQIGIRYEARPNENSGMGSSAISDNKGLYFINPEKAEGKPVQIWTQGETERNSKWYPTIDSPNERRSEEHTSELQSRENLVCRLLLEKKNHATSSGRR